MGCRLSKSSTKEEPFPRSFRVIGNPTLDHPTPTPTVSVPIKKEAISAPTAVPFSQFVQQVGVPETATPHIPGAFPTPPPFSQPITLNKSQPTRPSFPPLSQPLRPQTAPGPEAPHHPLQSNPTLQPPRPILLHRSYFPSLIPIHPPPNSPTSPSTPSPLRTIVFPPLPYVPPGMTLEQVLAPKGKRRMSWLREPGREMSVAEKRGKKVKGGVVRRERGGRGNKGLGGEVREAKEEGWEVEMKGRGGWFWRRRGEKKMV